MSANIPDFDDFIEITQKIRDLTLHYEVLDTAIKAEESALYQRFMTDPTTFKDGKPLANNAVKSAYEFTGIDGGLIPKRMELAQVKADLKQAELTFDVMKMQIDLYRTESANKRLSV